MGASHVERLRRIGAHMGLAREGASKLPTALPAGAGQDLSYQEQHRRSLALLSLQADPDAETWRTAAPLVLSDEQKSFFATFGYLELPGLLADRAEAIIRDFEQVWDSYGGGQDGKPHDGVNRSCIVPFFDSHPNLVSLIDDPRIDGLATGLLGDEWNVMGSDGNYYAGDTQWHSDGGHARGDPMHIKIAFYLDTLTRDTGALRLIPGSHLLGDSYADALNPVTVASRLPDFDTKEAGISGRDVPAVAIETVEGRGDVVVFNHNCKHAAFGGSSKRRMFTINLCQRYPAGKEHKLAEYLNGIARFLVDHSYSEITLATATPKRMRRLQQVMENDGHLAGLARAAAAEHGVAARG